VTLPLDRYLSALVEEANALATAAGRDLALQVPSCPEWTTADLLYHVGDVYWSWRRVVEERIQESPYGTFAPRPPDDELAAWAAEEARLLAIVLEKTDPETAIWTWAPQKNVAFLYRRMTHESAVHRVDAELAAAAPRPIASDVAADGIDEFFEFFLPADSEALTGPGEAVHLHATDSGDEWLVTVRDGSLTSERRHAKGDVAVRAPVSDLLLLLWRRVVPADVEVLGDREALQRFLARTNLS
jgi:uncharacterized protein (TIGR03083 family)